MSKLISVARGCLVPEDSAVCDHGLWSQPLPTESEGGGFVEAMAKQQNKSKSEIEKECFEHLRPSSLLKRFATVDEIAAMATYLPGELFSATNGVALRADGGVVRAIL